jgi:CheY-like chemotaxis protein
MASSRCSRLAVVTVTMAMQGCGGRDRRLLTRRVSATLKDRAMKLLIVDDSERVRGLIKRLVGHLCAAVRECADGAEAVAAYEEFRPDWMLMDIRMGQVDGLEATRQNVAAHPGARVVILTQCDEEQLQARAAGACGYVLKEDLATLREMLAAPPTSI